VLDACLRGHDGRGRWRDGSRGRGVKYDNPVIHESRIDRATKYRQAIATFIHTDPSEKAGILQGENPGYLGH